MNLNATLLIQMLCFAVFIWVTVKFIWPPITNALEERRKKIADGLAAAEQGQKDLELAQHKTREMLINAKAQASHIIEQANQRANHIVEESKTLAREEGERLLQLAKNEIDQEYNSAKEKLVERAAVLATAGAEKILKREVDAASNEGLINELSREL